MSVVSALQSEGARLRDDNYKLKHCYPPVELGELNKKCMRKVR